MTETYPSTDRVTAYDFVHQIIEAGRLTKFRKNLSVTSEIEDSSN